MTAGGTTLKLSGYPGLENGHVVATLYVTGYSDVRLLECILQREMRERAGTGDEARLAEWHNELASMRRRAEQENWKGWR